MTAVLQTDDSWAAAISPAPPAPMTSASKRWYMLATPRVRFPEGVRVEGDDGESTNHHEHECRDPQGGVGRHAPAVATYVVIDREPRAVDAMQQRQRQQQEVIHFPEGRFPAVGHERVVNLIHRVDDVHDDD